MELLQSITEAADEAPTVEDALRAALSRICVHTGWQAGRLQFSADAGDLAHRTFWHLMDPERLPSYRALAQARRDSPDVSLMARVLAHGSPLWTAVPDAAENGHAATGTRATVAFLVFLGTSLFALLEFFSDVEGRPEPATVDAVSLACAELGRILQRKPADDELRRSEREYRALFENARDAILIVDPREEVVVDANHHACEMYGFPRAELVGAPVERLWRDPALDRARLREAEQGAGGEYETRHTRKDGTEIVVDVMPGPVEYRGRRALWTSIRDVSDRIRVLEALRTSEERYRLLFDASPQAMWVFDAETLRFLAVNDAAVKRYGYSRDEFLRMTILDIRPPEDVPGLNDRLQGLAEGAAVSANIWRHRRATGELMDVEVTSHAIELSGRKARLVVSIDVTERLRAEEKLWHAAFYDALTGLPNRALFMERLGMALERAKGRGRGGFAVLFLDLDRFKVVNDSLGHRAGDQLLIQISRRLER
ncbi:MAG TPA: PAS domain S-box protein, partial [Myxococcales bacterium]